MVFAVASGLSGVLAIIAKGTLAATMSVTAFGAFALSQSVLLFVALFFEFGLFIPAARQAALGGGERDRREIVGAALLLYVPVGIVFCVAVAGLSLVIDAWSKVAVGDALLVTAALAFAWPLTVIGLFLAQGVGRLHVYSLTTLVGQAFFLLAVLLLMLLNEGLSVAASIAAKSISLLLASALLALWLRPKLSGAAGRMRTLVVQAKAYGFGIYVGRVLATGTYNADVLFLAALTDARAVAVYTLAGALAGGLGLPVVGLSSALFASMARGPLIAARWLHFAWVGGLMMVPVAWLVCTLAVGTVLSPAYEPMITLAVLLAVAQALRGVTYVYNSFLSAHARGRDLRNAGVVLTVSNLVLNFALIPPFGAVGAAWASILALTANYAAHVAGYHRYRSGLAAADTPA